MDLPSLIKLVSAIREAGCHRNLILFGSSSALASYPDLGTDEDSSVRHSRDADFVLDPWEDGMARQIHEQVGAGKPFFRGMALQCPRCHDLPRLADRRHGHAAVFIG